MSVLIKGMEMPTAPIILILFPDGHVETKEYNIGARSKAIPVPPHGRLIDADALLKDYESSFYRKAVVTLMEDAPTVIPAEEGE